MIPPTVSVVLPTYRRPEMLRLCLAALTRQTLAPLEICVGRRVDDAESAEVLAEFGLLTRGVVREAVVGADGNLVTSMNAALALTTSELVALTDDDAEAPADWLKRLASYFSDATIGGVGGRDWQPRERWNEREVGVLRWWGKVVGNHHLGIGPPRDVELLKGVNCCFRGAWLRSIGFDERLRGTGNVSHWEMHLCFAARRVGSRLVYDPSITVDHHIADRLDGDVNARGGFDRNSFQDGAFNGSLALLEHLPSTRRRAFRFWQFWLGTRSDPGVAQAVRLLLLGRPVREVIDRLCATRRAMRDASLAWKSHSGCSPTGDLIAAIPQFGVGRSKQDNHEVMRPT